MSSGNSLKSESQASVGKGPTLSLSSTQPSGVIHSAGREIGMINLATGLPLFSAEGQKWIQARSGRLLSKSKFALDTVERNDRSSAVSSSEPSEMGSFNRLTLPDQSIVEQCAESYQKSVFRGVLPVLDSILFKETIRWAYMSSNDSPKITGARTCIFAFLILAHFFDIGVPLTPTDKIGGYIAKINQSIPVFLEEMTLEAFQTCVMLVSPFSIFLWPAIKTNYT